MKTPKWIKRIINWIVNLYFDLIENIKFWLAKRKANKLHKQTGKRFHVVPASDRKLMVVDNTYVERYNHVIKGIRGAKKITFHDLIKMSYYSTSVNSPVLRERAKAK